MRPVDHVVQQLWAPALDAAEGALRVVENTAEDDTWADVERYWLVPSADRARLLVPRGPRRMTAAALTNYRNLRPRHVNLTRGALGAVARAGGPVSRDWVAVQARRSAPRASGLLPMSQLSAAFGGIRLYAATGVRTSDNRKTTLHLLSPNGRPLGYAKLGWTAPTDAFVANESRVLKEVGGRPGPSRAPRALAEISYLSHPVVVTEPLPLSVNGSLTGLAEPTAQEMFALTPLTRQARPVDTGQLAATADRLRASAGTDHVRPVAAAGIRLLEALEEVSAELPVTARWHGDMAPWNRARDTDGQLWVWDWESSEDDALGGLDAVHWTFSRRRLVARDVDAISLSGSVDDAGDYLLALGLAKAHWPVVAAAYALTVIERACGLADHSGTWSDAFISPKGLTGLADQALALLR